MQELQDELDIEYLNLLNSIIENAFNVKLEGCVYSEEEQVL